MNVFLICPSYSSRRNASFFPLGLASISSTLRQHGHQVFCLNLNNYDIEERHSRLEKILTENKIDVVGTGGLSMTLTSVEAIFKAVRRLSPTVKAVLGGGIVTADPFQIFHYVKPDYGVLGEGEETMVELMATLESQTVFVGDIPGLIHWSDGTMVKNIERPPIPDLQALPDPDLEGFGMRDYLDIQQENTFDYHLTSSGTGRRLPISASRSCPYKCTFCFHPLTQSYRKLPPEYIVDRILVLKEMYDVTFFAIYDELFDYKLQRIQLFCEQLLERNANIGWTCQLRVNKINLELLMLMKQAGCVWISYGFESGSDTILSSMQKKISASEIKIATELTRQAQIAIQANFLFGDPDETVETVHETVEFKNNNELHFIDWSAMIPFPGTQIFQLCLDRGLIKDSISFTKTISNASTFLWNTVQPPINMTTMPDDVFRRLYLELRESNDVSHRKRNAIPESFQFHSITDFTACLICPTCRVQGYYQLRYPPDAEKNQPLHELPYFAVRGINILCKNCHRKMHFPAWFLPEIESMYRKFQCSIYALCDLDREIVILSPMDRYFGTFSEKINLGSLNIIAVLDLRPYRQGQTFLNHSIHQLTTEAILANQHRNFVMLPSFNPLHVMKTVLDAGVPEDMILSWHNL